MSVVQPRVANVVQPNSDFVLLDGGRQLAYDAKIPSTGRLGVMIVFGFLLGLVAIGGGFTAFFGIGIGLTQGTDSVGVGLGGLAVAVVCVLAIVRLKRWTDAPKIRRIVFDEKSITFDGRTYLLDHVSSIGWRSAGSYMGGGSGFQGAALMAAAQVSYALSGQVYMQYGADEVVLVDKLHPEHTEAVYDKIVGFLAKFGRKFHS